LGYSFICGSLGKCWQTTTSQGATVKVYHKNTEYYIGRLTFWNGIHFTRRVQSDGYWYDYDGLNLNNLIKPVGDVTAPTPPIAPVGMSSHHVFISKNLHGPGKGTVSK
jgi:hypothetical protein